MQANMALSGLSALVSGQTQSPSYAAILAAGSVRFWGQANHPGNTLDVSVPTSFNTLADISGNGRNATQGTKANQPTQELAVLNGYPAMRFSAAGATRLAFTGAGLDVARNAPGLTTVVVTVPTLPASGNGTLFFSSSGSAAAANRWNNYIVNTAAIGSSARRADADSQSNRSGGTITGGVGQVLTYLWDIPDQSLYMFSNNTLVNQLLNAFGTVGAATSDTAAQAANIGSLGAGSYFTGDILEIVVFGKLLTTSERTDVVSTLMTKYGL
jgi:hypothetical protein